MSDRGYVLRLGGKAQKKTSIDWTFDPDTILKGTLP